MSALAIHVLDTSNLEEKRQAVCSALQKLVADISDVTDPDIEAFLRQPNLRVVITPGSS